MRHAELMARLERERISYPDDLPGERLAPTPVERVAGRTPAYTPIGERQAERNRARLLAALNGSDET